MNHWHPLEASAGLQSGEKHSSLIFPFPPRNYAPVPSHRACQTPFRGYQTQKSPDEKQYQSQIQEYHFPPPGDIGHDLPPSRSAHSPLSMVAYLQVALSKHPLSERRPIFLSYKHTEIWRFPWTQEAVGTAPAHPPSQGGEKALSPWTFCHASVTLPPLLVLSLHRLSHGMSGGASGLCVQQ